MAKKPLTALGLAAKIKLLEINRTQGWLAQQVATETRLYVDGSLLYKVFTGENENPKLVAAIWKVLFEAQSESDTRQAEAVGARRVDREGATKDEAETTKKGM